MLSLAHCGAGGRTDIAQGGLASIAESRRSAQVSIQSAIQVYCSLASTAESDICVVNWEISQVHTAGAGGFDHYVAGRARQSDSACSR